MSTHDLVIRAGTVVDGTGTAGWTADVAVDGGRISAVGRVAARGRREIDAAGALVTPGFVDIHTHYDGQATWDRQLAPSSWHGVTTAVMGNCGVGFAPVRPADHQRLIELMEGVEDIPGAALHEGLTWAWETFPQYLDDLDGHDRDLDLGAQVPHGALRLHVMGERGAARQPATPDDIAAMAELAKEAIEAGALGFTTSRTMNHRSSRGELTPTLTAEADELIGIAEALGSIGAGVLQVVSDFQDVDHEFAILRAMAARSGRPISISVAQSPLAPEQWKDLLDRMAEATAEGVTMRGQVGARAVGLLLGFETTLNPFMMAPRWAELKDLPPAARAARLCREDVRRALVDNVSADRQSSLIGGRLIAKFHLMFPLGDPPDYEPDPASSVAAMAERQGRSPAEVAYDVLLGDGATALLYMPTLNYVDGSLDAVGAQLRHPASVAGLSDGGAHVGTICDVSFPTTLLQWWGRDRPSGRLPVELLVHKQTQATAQTVGLLDRGVLAPGYRGDVNVIDFDRLGLHAPEIRYDLPAGGRRLVQRADGYVHTFVAGTEIRADGESTAATPGRLVRGAQPAPTPA
ncbi:MAG: amidohydrolase family protein [Acidimicrobiia bacterium]|nr:amidohydrolase family protein [Acidimicrobiia bacterium]